MGEITPRIDASVAPTDMDKLTVAKSIEKKWHDEMVEPLESKVKDELLRRKEEEGIDKITTSKFLGYEGGTMLLSKRKGKPSEKGTRFTCYDVDKAIDWMDRERPDTDCFAQDNIEQFAEWHFRSTGELPDGCQVLEYETEAQPDKLIPTFKPNVDYTIQALLGMGGNVFESAERLMLGEGDGSY